jgi:hypothetical protein
VIELDYLLALSEAVPLDDWRAIVKTAADEARKGDRYAREWLTRYLVGANPTSLTGVAAEEAFGMSVEDLLAWQGRKRDQDRRVMETFWEDRPKG